MRRVRLLLLVLTTIALGVGGGWLWLHRSSLLAGHRARSARPIVAVRTPVAILSAGGQRVPVAGDGTLLPGANLSEVLPTVSLPAAPRGSRVADSGTRAVLATLAAAPSQLLNHVSSATDGAAHGVVIELRNGPSLYFGQPGLERAKWTAASEVLADPGSRGASYIDLSDPGRPAAG